MMAHMTHLARLTDWASRAASAFAIVSPSTDYSMSTRWLAPPQESICRELHPQPNCVCFDDRSSIAWAVQSVVLVRWSLVVMADRKGLVWAGWRQLNYVPAGSFLTCQILVFLKHYRSSIDHTTEWQFATKVTTQDRILTLNSCGSVSFMKQSLSCRLSHRYVSTK